MPRHFDYTLHVPCSPAEAYERITSPDGWRGSEVYGKIHWAKGEPWQPGSVREVETLHPFRMQHHETVLAAHPGEALEIRTQATGGITNHTRIRFASAAAGGASITYSIDVAGPAFMPASLIDDFVHRFMDAYLPELKKLCEK